VPFLDNLRPEGAHGSFVERLQRAAEEVCKEPGDPWLPRLEKLKGRIGHDGVERISTHDIFDILEVPMQHRARQTVRLSGLMRGIGWASVRARGLNPGGYKDRVRGYAREVTCDDKQPTVHD
jgi:hypothetical protein